MITSSSRPTFPPGSGVAPDVRIGEGTIIRGEVEIRSGVRLGSHCIIEGAPGRKTILEEGCVVEDYARVGPGVVLGSGSHIGAHVLLGHPSKEDLAGQDDVRYASGVQDLLVPEPLTVIGAGSIVRSHSIVYSHVRIGARFVTGHGALVREHTTIAEECVFGTYASTDGSCQIGAHTHIGQYCQLSKAARIGRGTFIGGHTVFSDNKLILRDAAQDLSGVLVEDYVRLGLGCVILPAITIGRGALVGAGSLITRDVPAGALAYGNPARPVRQLTEEEVSQYIVSVGRGESQA